MYRLVYIAMLLISMSKMLACSCNNFNLLPYPNIITFNSYDEVILGEIISTDSCVSFTVKIEKVFHGDLKVNRNVKVYNEKEDLKTCNSSCDRFYENGTRFIFYLNHYDNKSFINPICSAIENLSYYDNGDRKEMLALYEKVSKYSLQDGYTSLKKNDGKMVYSGYIKNGHAHGLWKIYYSNGKIEEEGEYEGGQRIGTWTTYYYNKEYSFEKGRYENGEKVGKWMTYDNEGKELGLKIYTDINEQKWGEE